MRISVDLSNALQVPDDDESTLSTLVRYVGQDVRFCYVGLLLQPAIDIVVEPSLGAGDVASLGEIEIQGDDGISGVDVK